MDILLYLLPTKRKFRSLSLCVNDKDAAVLFNDVVACFIRQVAEVHVVHIVSVTFVTTICTMCTIINFCSKLLL